MITAGLLVRACHNVRLSAKCGQNSALADNIQNTSAILAGTNLGCFDIFLVLADRLINLADKIKNLSVTLAGNNFELCLTPVSTDHLLRPQLLASGPKLFCRGGLLYVATCANPD